MNTCWSSVSLPRTKNGPFKWLGHHPDPLQLGQIVDELQRRFDHRYDFNFLQFAVGVVGLRAGEAQQVFDHQRGALDAGFDLLPRIPCGTRC